MSVRIGVYLCHCGANIAGKVDIDAVADFARGLENVTLLSVFISVNPCPISFLLFFLFTLSNSQ